MAKPASHRKPDALRVLLTEGNSTSAREALTVLGLAGHDVDICDPASAGLARFSRFIRRWHRCRGLRDDPLGFRRDVERMCAARHYDVLLPIHEQGLVLAGVQDRLTAFAGLALPAFEHYRTAHSKAGFSRLLAALGLPQPHTVFVRSASELLAAAKPPCVIKTAIGTASRGVWMVRDHADLAQAVSELVQANAFVDDVLVQAWSVGAIEKAQGVFCRGRLVGFHATRQLMEGAGGGDAVKRSVHRAQVRIDLAAIGACLEWHGALSIDGIAAGDGSGLVYIDCNPRLVEPMAAYLAGTDLVDLLLRVSRGETPAPLPDGRADVTTHQALQVLLGAALRGGSRADLWRLVRDMWHRRGVFAGSAEELTPPRLDWPSVVPLLGTTVVLLMAPRLARTLATRGWGAHLLDARSVAIIVRDRDP